MRFFLALVCCICLMGCKDDTQPKTNLLVATSNGDLYNIAIAKGQLLWKLEGNKNTDELTFFTLRDNTILRAYSDKRVAEIDRDSGKVNWTFNDVVSPSHGAYGYDFKGVGHYFFGQYPVVYGNAFIFGNTLGEVKSVDLKTRAVNWTHQASWVIFNSPILVNGKLLVNKNYRLEFIDPDTGKKISSLEFAKPLTQQVIFDGNAIYAIDEEGTVFCIDTTLAILWQHGNKDARSIQAIGSSSVITEGVQLGSLDKKTGAPQWAIDIPKQTTKKDVESKNGTETYTVSPKKDAVRAVEFVKDTLIVATPHYLLKLDASSGKIIHQHYFADREIVGKVQHYAGVYYYLCSDEVVYKMDNRLEKETIVSRNISYKTQRKEDDAHLVFY